MKLQTAHFSPHIGAGGLGQAVPKLCAALAECGNAVRLHVLAPKPERAPLKTELFVHPRANWLKPLGVSASLKRAVRGEVARADILHVHSLWTMANIYPGLAARPSKCKLVHSPHGTMAAWAMAHRKWRKKAVWTLLQRAALERADCIFVTSEKEFDDVRRLRFKQPAALIPIGIDIPDLNSAAKSAKTLRRLLFLGRVHPVKALDRLLRSWKLLQTRFPEWELVIAGGDEESYSDVLKALGASLKLERVSFAGHVNEGGRDAMYQSADLFVLPSHTENFGMAVAESLANGVPAVVSFAAPWENLAREKCGWSTSNEPEALAESLAAAMARPASELRDMGLRGRAWMQREFSWARAADMTIETYTWLLGNAARPAWIR